MGSPASGTPARGYSWPPFKKGHTMSLRHGGRSPRTYQPVADELAAGLLVERPWLAAYPEAVAAWAEYEARADVLRRWLADRELLDDDGVKAEVSGAVKLLGTMERGADRMRQRLGLDPRADADLVRASAEAAAMTVDLDGIREHGREALARRGDVIDVEGLDGE